MYIYHITEQSTWNLATRDGVYVPGNYMREGFIHCSTSDQVLDTAERYYANISNLVLLQIAVEQLKSKLLMENLIGGEEMFPHVYGPINLDAVVSVSVFEKGSDGKFHFPFLC